MLIGLADDAVYDGPTEEPGDRSTSISTPVSTITVGPMTIGPAKVQPRPRGVASSFLDAVAPKKLSAGGKVTIWGMPPAVAYTLAAVILTGAGLWAYQNFGGRKTSNPRRRRRARGGRARGRRKR